MIELNFSGSSVAIGAMTRASSVLSTLSCVAMWSTASTKKIAPRTIRPRATTTCRLTTRSRGTLGSTRCAFAIEAMETERSEVLGVDVWIGLEVALDVPGIDPDQDDGHEPLQLDRLDRQERGADGQPVGDREVAHVMGQDAGVDLHHVAGGSSTSLVEDGDAGHEHGERREHERRPQDRADADLVRRRARREQDGDDRDHRLGQCRADRGEHGTHRALGQFELASEPFDAVREQLRAHQDDHECQTEDEQIHAQTVTAMALPTPIAMTARIASEITTMVTSPSEA